MVEYSKTEFLIACASSHVRDGEMVFGGTGMPLLAALLAKETHAPKSNLISEAGYIDARPREVPLSVADTRYYYGCSASIGLIETLGFLLQALVPTTNRRSSYQEAVVVTTLRHLQSDSLS